MTASSADLVGDCAAWMGDPHHAFLLTFVFGDEVISAGPAEATQPAGITAPSRMGPKPPPGPPERLP